MMFTLGMAVARRPPPESFTLTLTALVFWAIYVRWRRFRRRRIDPMLEDVEEGFADASDAVKGTGSRMRGWFGGRK